jgi:transposase InsO family protein
MEQGIVAQYSMPGESQQNGVAEGRNRTLMDMVRSMISYSTLPVNFMDGGFENHHSYSQQSSQ